MRTSDIVTWCDAVKDIVRFSIIRIPLHALRRPLSLLPIFVMQIELAVQLGDGLLPVRAAVALDMTLRDVQAELKAAKYPWTLAKVLI